VNRQDNPFKVREIILEVIGTLPKILSNPAPDVYFQATDQMLLSFKIQYYVDLSKITSRIEVNSEFLFVLWERFAQENISHPEVIHKIYLNQYSRLQSLSDNELNTPQQKHA
jgi:potassium efflux system protein